MTRERFVQILKEYGYKDNVIKTLWNTRPTDDLDETAIRATTLHMHKMVKAAGQATDIPAETMRLHHADERR